jgi:hypothetical protein
MVFQWFKRLFKNKQALDSTQSLTQSLNQANTQTNTQPSDSSEPIEIEKESLQLGVAAGYTGRFIQDIHTTLNRIETLMPSKDWLVMQLREQFSQHEENEQKRFETLVNALNTIHSISIEAPEPVKARLLDTLSTAESRLGLSNRMKELVQLVKYSGEVSYPDLAKKMDLTESGFRSLLAMTLRRTNEVEKFERDGRKWLRYKKSDALSVQSSANPNHNQSNEQSNTNY